MDRDKLLRGSLEDAYKAAYNLIDRLQDKQPSTQVQGIALALTAVADALGLDMRELIRLGEKLGDLGQEKKLRLYAALRDYAKNELKA